MNLSAFWELLKDTVKQWIDDGVPRLGAALAFYTLLSVAPLLVVVTALAGLLFGEQAAQGQIVDQIKDLVGPTGASTIQTMLANAHRPTLGTWMSVLSAVVLLIGATGLFAELQSDLNTVWGVEPKPGNGIWQAIKDRFFSFLMVLVIGALLLASLVASTALSALTHFAGGHWPRLAPWLHLGNFVVSLGLFTVLFAAVYRILPDAKIAWGDVWIGAAVTAVLFTLGKFLIGLYLAYGSVGSPYGAAGSLAVFLIWVYYSAQVLFLGAEFTQVYACRFGSCIQPAKGSRIRPRFSAAAGKQQPAT
jgi:membrane protein